MTTLRNASMRGAAVAASNGPSVSRPNVLSGEVRDAPQSNDWSLVYGKAAAAPATFAALTDPQTTNSLQWDRVVFTNVGIVAHILFSLSLADCSMYAPGDHLWLCFFAEGAPAGADVPTAVVDLGLAVAQHLALTVVDPPAGHPMGYGQRILVHSSTPPTGAETMRAILIWLDPLNVPRSMAAGSGVISAGSQNASVMFGLSYFGEWESLGATAPRGAPLGAVLELDLIRRDAAGANVETATVAAWFTHDPVSQLATLHAMLPPPHDPMLDLILQSVRRTYSSF